MSRAHRRPHILAVASGGGHWVELLRLRPSFEGCRVAYLTVQRAYERDVVGSRFHVVNDATRWSRAGLAILALQVLVVLLRERPDVVVSTGAAPGYFAIRLGRLLGARTCWVDSIANVETLSLSGQRVGPFADLWLTQWEHLAQPGGPSFHGGVV